MTEQEETIIREYSAVGHDAAQWKNVDIRLMLAEIDTLRAALAESEAKREELESSMTRHFNEEHLAGDGPEIDRWKIEAQKLREALEAIVNYHGMDGRAVSIAEQALKCEPAQESSNG